LENLHTMLLHPVGRFALACFALLPLAGHAAANLTETAAVREAVDRAPSNP
jgi:hypothetical protein